MIDILYGILAYLIVAAIGLAVLAVMCHRAPELPWHD